MKPRPHLLKGERLPPEPVQKRSLAKRERLKTAALDLFGRKGYEATSIEDVAARAGLAVGTFYQHYRSKRQLLLALMDELLENLSRLDLRPRGAADPRAILHAILSAAFAHDLRFLGAYRAWQQAAISDADLRRKQARIQDWTTARVTLLFEGLSRLPGARREADIPALARAMDTYFWTLLAQASLLSRRELEGSVGAATHLIFHALFTDEAEAGARDSLATEAPGGASSPGKPSRVTKEERR
ncbi:MAG TPA: helix-turn-helix domain-containing protein [Candidatus Micrarchaeaceae archaeon]|nr:helix-turn-helix domain-containing protein [Candidatus Micrarchaeaceae archaeon]